MTKEKLAILKLLENATAELTTIDILNALSKKRASNATRNQIYVEELHQDGYIDVSSNDYIHGVVSIKSKGRDGLAAAQQTRSNQRRLWISFAVSSLIAIAALINSVLARMGR